MEAGEYAGLLNNGFCKICCLIKRRVAGMIAIEISGELRRLIVVMGSILGLLLLLSGCGSGSQTSRHISQQPVTPTKEARQEIGRVSWRERVCQDVLFTVVAVALKKKITK